MGRATLHRWPRRCADSDAALLSRPRSLAFAFVDATPNYESRQHPSPAAGEEVSQLRRESRVQRLGRVHASASYRHSERRPSKTGLPEPRASWKVVATNEYNRVRTRGLDVLVLCCSPL